MTDLHSAVGSYAVDALSPVERAEFETHLRGCISCRREVAEFAEALAGLAPLTAADPPAALRASVLAAATSGVRQLGPRLAARAEERSAVDDRPEVAPRRAMPAQVTELRPMGPDEVAPLEEHPSVLPETPWLDVAAVLSQDMDQSRGRRRDRLLAVLVAAALVMAVALSGWVYVSREQSQTRAVQAQQEVDLLTAPDAKVYASTVDGNPVSFVVSRRLNKALFIGNRLDDPGRNRTYQLWVVRGGTPTRAGSIGEGGSVRVRLDGPVRDADRLALSKEPTSGGSSEPTRPLLADVSLS